MRADLHVHTYYSDGFMSPAQVIDGARGNGVDLLAVTDHDTVKGVEICAKYAKTCGIKYVRGAEISAYLGDTKIHMLCYNADLEKMRGFFDELKRGATARAEDILYKLKKSGISLTMDDVLAQMTCKDAPPHVMHIAAAGEKLGFAGNRFEFFNKYLAYGKAGFSCICRPDPERTAEIISSCGGLASIAHPGRITLPAPDVEKLIKRLVPCGLKGIECVYSSHTKQQTEYYKELAKELGLYVTGGSDTHFQGGGRAIGSPDFEPDDALLHELKIC